MKVNGSKFSTITEKAGRDAVDDAFREGVLPFLSVVFKVCWCGVVSFESADNIAGLLRMVLCTGSFQRDSRIVD